MVRTFFVERGYPTHLLDSAIQKAFNNSRRDTLKPPLAKISDDKIPLVLTFHSFNYKVRDVISRNFQILKNDYLFLHPIMHLLLFLSPYWLTFCHMIIPHINSLGFLFTFCFFLTKGLTFQIIRYK